MKVIFKKDLAKIGKKHQVKDVSNGYAVNFLIPNGYAVMATPETEKEVANLKVAMDVEKNVQSSLLQKNMKVISESRLKIFGKANEKGHLFSGIHSEQILSELQKQMHIMLPPDSILIEKPLKEIGEHKIEISVGDKKVWLVVEVTAH